MEFRQAQRSLPLTAETRRRQKAHAQDDQAAEERRRAQGPFGADGHARADARRASRRQLPAPISPLNAAHHQSRGRTAAPSRPSANRFWLTGADRPPAPCRPLGPLRRSRAQPAQALAITEREGDPHEQPEGQPNPRDSLRRVFNLTTNRSNLQSATRSAEIGESSSPTTRTQPRVTSWRPRGRPASSAATWVWGE